MILNGKSLPLIVIVGPTASGKTALAIRLAEQCGGEIISADSRAIYRGLDIGTAKPSEQERRAVPHWGIDIVGPGERFTAADFKRYANEKIAEIRQRGHVPFLVGGTGLYINSVVYDYDFSNQNEDLARRDELQSWTLEQLHRYCLDNNVILPENKYNKRYVVNSILRYGEAPKRKYKIPGNTIIVGITTKKEELWSRISARSRVMWVAGLPIEAVRAGREYGWDSEALTGNTYRVTHDFLEGKINESEAQERISIVDRQLAKRQLTWFRRDEHIEWFSAEDAYTYLARVLEACSNS